VLFTAILLAWVAKRRREGLIWDMPRHVTVLLLMYLGVILVGVARAILDRSGIEDYPLKSLISEQLINTIKWALPGILLFDGCRTRRQVIMALVCIITVYFVISIQVHRLLPMGSILQGGDSIEYTRQACKGMGYAATDLAVMLAGASWGLLAIMPLFHRKYWIVILMAVGTVVTALVLTGGRAGYVAWGATGLVLCLIKWRRYLVLGPVIVMLLPAVFPGAAGRMLRGFGVTDVSGNVTIDDYAVTSDRTFFWPYVTRKISQSPLIGYGRLAMQRTGLCATIEADRSGTGAPHPHNVYLETLLDNGILGSLPIFILWGVIVLYSTRLFRSDNRLYSASGGLALAIILTSLIGGLSGQHYFPQEHTLGLWAAAFLMFRVHVEEKRAQAAVANTVVPWSEQLCEQRMAVA
jgi:O-antigen ligase